ALSSPLHDAFRRVAVVVLHAGLVAADLAIELVDQFIERGVEVRVRALRKHVVALHMDAALGALPSFLFLLLFNREEYLDVHDLFEMTGDAIELGGHVVSESGGNFEMVTADRQVHGASCDGGWTRAPLRRGEGTLAA